MSFQNSISVELNIEQVSDIIKGLEDSEIMNTKLKRSLSAHSDLAKNIDRSLERIKELQAYFTIKLVELSVGLNRILDERTELLKKCEEAANNWKPKNNEYNLHISREK